MTYPERTLCPNCGADIEHPRFCDPFRCWHCGRPVRVVHECGEEECCEWAEDPDREP